MSEPTLQCGHKLQTALRKQSHPSTIHILKLIRDLFRTLDTIIRCSDSYESAISMVGKCPDTNFVYLNTRRPPLILVSPTSAACDFSNNASNSQVSQMFSISLQTRIEAMKPIHRPHLSTNFSSIIPQYYRRHSILLAWQLSQHLWCARSFTKIYQNIIPQHY